MPDNDYLIMDAEISYRNFLQLGLVDYLTLLLKNKFFIHKADFESLIQTQKKNIRFMCYNMMFNHYPDMLYKYITLDGGLSLKTLKTPFLSETNFDASFNDGEVIKLAYQAMIQFDGVLHYFKETAITGSFNIEMNEKYGKEIVQATEVNITENLSKLEIYLKHFLTPYALLYGGKVDTESIYRIVAHFSFIKEIKKFLIVKVISEIKKTFFTNENSGVLNINYKYKTSITTTTSSVVGTFSEKEKPDSLNKIIVITNCDK